MPGASGKDEPGASGKDDGVAKRLCRRRGGTPARPGIGGMAKSPGGEPDAASGPADFLFSNAFLRFSSQAWRRSICCCFWASCSAANCCCTSCLTMALISSLVVCFWQEQNVAMARISGRANEFFMSGLVLWLILVVRTKRVSEHAFKRESMRPRVWRNRDSFSLFERGKQRTAADQRKVNAPAPLVKLPVSR